MLTKSAFSPSERRILSKLNSPRKIQDFLDNLDYTFGENGELYYSPRKVLSEKSADCLEGAVFAAAALRFHGNKPLVISTSSVRDDDHVFALFKNGGHWGAISKSKYTGLSYREPIHRNLRELMISYFEEYFNYDGEKTLRGYSRIVNLARFDKLDWMTTDRPISFIEDHLNEVPYYWILKNGAVRRLRRVTPIMLRSGELWLTENKMLERAKKVFRKT